MTSLQRVRIALSGFIGGPGVATHYCVNAASALPELKGLWAGFAALMASTVEITYPTSGDIIDDVHGELVGSWTADARTGDVGQVSGSYPAPSGACVNWLTGAVADGHRLRGRTFVVPLGYGAYALDGSLSDATIADLEEIANAKISTMGTNLRVWHRPGFTMVDEVAVPRAGSSAAVTSAVVNDRAAVLTSRRG